MACHARRNWCRRLHASDHLRVRSKRAHPGLGRTLSRRRRAAGGRRCPGRRRSPGRRAPRPAGASGRIWGARTSAAGRWTVRAGVCRRPPAGAPNEASRAGKCLAAGWPCRGGRVCNQRHRRGSLDRGVRGGGHGLLGAARLGRLRGMRSRAGRRSWWTRAPAALTRCWAGAETAGCTAVRGCNSPEPPGSARGGVRTQRRRQAGPPKLTCCVALSTSSCHWLLGSVWRGSEPCPGSCSIWAQQGQTKWGADEQSREHASLPWLVLAGTPGSSKRRRGAASSSAPLRSRLACCPRTAPRPGQAAGRAGCRQSRAARRAPAGTSHRPAQGAAGVSVGSSAHSRPTQRVASGNYPACPAACTATGS